MSDLERARRRNELVRQLFADLDSAEHRADTSTSFARYLRIVADAIESNESERPPLASLEAATHAFWLLDLSTPDGRVTPRAAITEWERRAQNATLVACRDVAAWLPLVRGALTRNRARRAAPTVRFCRPASVGEVALEGDAWNGAMVAVLRCTEAARYAGLVFDPCALEDAVNARRDHVMKARAGSWDAAAHVIVEAGIAPSYRTLVRWKRARPLPDLVVPIE